MTRKGDAAMRVLFIANKHNAKTVDALFQIAAYCDMQGNIFMAAIDQGIPMEEFAPVYMNSQLAGVIDYSFSCAGNMESDSLSSVLKMPLLLKRRFYIS